MPAQQSADHAPSLTRTQERQARKAAALDAPTIHETIRRQGEDELERGSPDLFFSGLASGLSMGFSFLAQAVIKATLPDEPWARLISTSGYAVGFLIVILGRQQLYTESTLTAMIPVLAHRRLKTLAHMCRLWIIVLIANLLGALLYAWLLQYHDLLEPTVTRELGRVARHGVEGDFTPLLLRAIVAGWLVATTAWVLPSVRHTQFFIILTLTWLIGAAHLPHVIASAGEAFYLALSGDMSCRRALTGFLLPVLLGNTIGGVLLVAGLNHAQVHKGEGAGHEAT